METISTEIEGQVRLDWRHGQADRECDVCGKDLSATPHVALVNEDCEEAGCDGAVRMELCMACIEAIYGVSRLYGYGPPRRPTLNP